MPLQGKNSEAVPALARIKVLKETGQIPRKRAEFGWETVPGRVTHSQEGPMLFNGCVSMTVHMEAEW